MVLHLRRKKQDVFYAATDMLSLRDKGSVPDRPKTEKTVEKFRKNCRLERRRGPSPLPTPGIRQQADYQVNY